MNTPPERRRVGNLGREVAGCPAHLPTARPGHFRPVRDAEIRQLRSGGLHDEPADVVVEHHVEHSDVIRMMQAGADSGFPPDLPSSPAWDCFSATTRRNSRSVARDKISVVASRVKVRLLMRFLPLDVVICGSVQRGRSLIIRIRPPGLVPGRRVWGWVPEFSEYTSGAQVAAIPPGSRLQPSPLRNQNDGGMVLSKNTLAITRGLMITLLAFGLGSAGSAQAAPGRPDTAAQARDLGLEPAQISWLQNVVGQGWDPTAVNVRSRVHGCMKSSARCQSGRFVVTERPSWPVQRDSRPGVRPMPTHARALDEASAAPQPIAPSCSSMRRHASIVDGCPAGRAVPLSVNTRPGGLDDH